MLALTPISDMALPPTSTPPPLPQVLDEHLRTLAGQKNIEIDVNRLHWTPYGHMVSGASGRK